MDTSHPCQPPNELLTQASLVQHRRNILEACCPIVLPPIPETTPGTVDSPCLQARLSPHPYYSFLYSSLSITDAQGHAIAEVIQGNSLLGCSDGSYDPITRKASYGLVLGTVAGPILRVFGPCPCHPNSLLAICAELCSINVAMHLLKEICAHYGITRGEISLYNDCMKAQKYILQSGRKFERFLVDDYNIISEIGLALKVVKQHASLNLLWVKGHYSGSQRDM